VTQIVYSLKCFPGPDLAGGRPGARGPPPPPKSGPDVSSPRVLVGQSELHEYDLLT